MSLADNAGRLTTTLLAPAIGLVAGAGNALAQAAAPVASASPAAAASPAASATAAAVKTAAAGAYVPMKPTPGVGMPVDGAIGFQTQFSPIGEQGLWMHNVVLMPIITLITVVVLGLLVYVMLRFNRRANPVPSKTSHNTVIEVIWTLVPVLVLAAIAIPSIDLLAKQYKPAPAKALTVKATGYQWYWGYTYPDNGGFEVISNMLPEEEAIKRGEPPHLGADARMVVPAGEPIRLQTTGADVIHAFAVPSLWFKIDAVPGRINERVLTIEKPGVYYGQCSELCGARHGYMPIVVEALPRPQFEQWVLAQGGTLASSAPAGGNAPTPAASKTPASSAPGAPPVAATPAAGAASAAPAASATPTAAAGTASAPAA